MIVFTVDDRSAKAGGARAGQYLQSIGQTDLAQLNVEQFGKFCTILVGEAFKAGMDGYMEAAECEPPF